MRISKETNKDKLLPLASTKQLCYRRRDLFIADGTDHGCDGAAKLAQRAEAAFMLMWDLEKKEASPSP